MKSIEIIEKSINIKFSKEQLDIVENAFNQTLLVNACAGAGKTTVMILTMLNLILQNNDPSQFLGITFSKKAQTNMNEKYNQYVNAIQNNANITITKSPDFKTFHSLYLQMLKNYKGFETVTVLPSYSRWLYQLKMAIPNDVLASKDDMLENIFNEYSKIKNNNMSIDGIHDEYGVNLKDFAKDIVYINVIQTYNKLKKQNNVLDFDDIQIKLYSNIKKYGKKPIQHILDKYEYLIIDEFQDISPLQWANIKECFENKFKKLVVIGDDDQSIYSFRGASNEIILNFDKTVKNTKTLKLSTNYRTGGNILDDAKSIITENKKRLSKTLNSSNPKMGKLVSIEHPYDAVSKNNDFLKILTKDIILDPDAKSAILIRFNIDKKILIDWFESYGIKTNIQNTLIYDSLYNKILNLMYSLYYQDINALKEAAPLLGFKKLKNQLNNVINLDFTNATQIIKKTIKYPNKFEELLILIEKDKNRKITQKQEKIKIFELLSICMSTYFNFMISMKALNEINFTKISEYIEYSFNSFDGNGIDYLTAVSKKKVGQASYITHTNIEILTLHQSKGLEFDNVYLYGLRNTTTQSNLFGSKLLNITNKDLEKFTIDLDESYAENEFQSTLADKEQNYKSILESKIYEKLKHKKSNSKMECALDALTSKDLEKLRNKKVSNEWPFKKLNDIIEEERRLIYVGITRAKYKCVIDKPLENVTCLLDKL